MKTFYAAFLSVLGAQPVMAGEVRCHIDQIISGNTFSCVTAEHQRINVRLDYIDAPELSQAYGREALLLLTGLVFDKTVTLYPRGTNLYGETVAEVTYAGVNISREMVRLGGALVFDTYNCDARLPEIQEEARAERRGLWGLPEDNINEIIEPWKVQIPWQVAECPRGER